MCKIMGKLFLFGLIGLFISWGALYYRYSDEKNTQARRYRLENPPILEKTLAINDHLQKATHILENKIIGPESMVVDDGMSIKAETVNMETVNILLDAIYATIYDAKVIKIVDGKIVAKAAYSERSKFFPDCGNFANEPGCGRPLGIRKLVPNLPKFVVADSYLGIYIVDFTEENNPTTTQILDSRVPINGLAPRFLNDLDVLNEDELIISDSSTKYDRRHFMPLILEHQADGRILRLKISSKKVDVVLDKLYFPNGVQIMPDRKSVIFSECSMARIKRVWIDSKKVEMFAANLPGMPDNIRVTKRNTFWVGLAATRHSDAPSLVDKLGSLPGIRQFLIDIIPGNMWEFITHTFKRPHSMIIELDKDGKIIRSLHDVTGKFVGDVSQVNEHNNILYLGSFNSPYIAKVEL